MGQRRTALSPKWTGSPEQLQRTLTSIPRKAPSGGPVTLTCACPCGGTFARSPSLVGRGLAFLNGEHRRRYHEARHRDADSDGGARRLLSI